jgi:UPF0176 protein
MSFRIIAFYKFTPFPDYRELQSKLQEFCVGRGIRGTVLLASEGINGTVSGTYEAISELINYLRTWDGMSDFEWKESFADTIPFVRMKVRLKKEIVAFGVQTVDPNKQVGTYLNSEEWNKLILDPNVIDTRNQFEVDMGTFKNAVSPNTKAFRQFPKFVQEELANAKDKKVAMFCTGGIRCEKATSYMLQEGFKEVYHLHGGILKYFEEMPKERSLFEGECFVFDERISVNHDLKKGSYDELPPTREYDFEG